MNTTEANYVKRGLALVAAAIVHAGKGATARYDGAHAGEVLTNAKQFLEFMEGRK